MLFNSLLEDAEKSVITLALKLVLKFLVPQVLKFLKVTKVLVVFEDDSILFVALKLNLRIFGYQTNVSGTFVDYQE